MKALFESLVGDFCFSPSRFFESWKIREEEEAATFFFVSFLYFCLLVYFADTLLLGVNWNLSIAVAQLRNPETTLSSWVEDPRQLLSQGLPRAAGQLAIAPWRQLHGIDKIQDK